MMEPWDCPAAIAVTNGRQIGATLDRNGLRPSRYIVTEDDLVIMGSECGCLPVPEERIVKKWRLQPGKMFLVDLEKGRIIDDKELKDSLASARPYAEWIERIRVKLDEVESDKATPIKSKVRLLDRQQAFAYTQEDLKFIMQPMAAAGEEPVGSMGNDSPLAVLSNKDKTLYHYFKQLFAQVTNPAIDPIREELVMSLVSFIGPTPNLLGIDELNRRLRRRIGASLSRPGNHSFISWPGPARGFQGGQELRQGDRQGPEEGHVQDGDLDLHVVHRVADLRGRRAGQIAGRQILHRHHLERRGHRRVRRGRGSDPCPSRGVRRGRPGPQDHARRRR